MDKLSCQVLTVGNVGLESAIDLLSRFFAEEGVSGDRSVIAADTRRMIADSFHWLGYIPRLPGEGRDLFRPQAPAFACVTRRVEHFGTRTVGWFALSNGKSQSRDTTLG